MQFAKIVGWKSADPGGRAEAVHADKAENAAGLSTGQRILCSGWADEPDGQYLFYEANHTLYVVSVYAQGQELSYDRYSSVKDSIAAVKSAATAISKIHNKGFLYRA